MRKDREFDDETVELCKEVYRRTKWGLWDLNYTPVDSHCTCGQIGVIRPYTSDYILEKLPQGIKGNYLNMFNAGPTSWYALYGRTTTAKETGLYGEGNSPLKALLKLVIALDDAGELK